VKDATGEITVRKAAEEGPLGSALGFLTGGLIGVLGGPVGMATGAFAGSVNMAVPFSDDFAQMLSTISSSAKALRWKQTSKPSTTSLRRRVRRTGSQLNETSIRRSASSR
jgi:uncharacterized membrane protein